MKTSKITIGSICFLLFVFNNINSQSIIKGKLTDVCSNPLHAAMVFLVNTQGGTLIKGAVTKEDGSFLIRKIKPGSYRLKYSVVGYQPIVSHPIRVSSQATHIDIGVQEIKETDRPTPIVFAQAEIPKNKSKRWLAFFTIVMPKLQYMWLS